MCLENDAVFAVEFFMMRPIESSPFRILGLPYEILELPSVFIRPEPTHFPNFLKSARKCAERFILYISLKKLKK
jgi:hypothetical protein